MDVLRFYVRFNSSSVISGRWADGIERLCAIEPRLRLKRSPPQAGLEPGTAGSKGKRLTHSYHWQTEQTQIRRHIMWRLIWVCVVCEQGFSPFTE